MNQHFHMLIITEPPVRSVLHASSCLTVHCARPMPNLWRRFWYWLLLGWVWREP